MAASVAALLRFNQTGLGPAGQMITGVTGSPVACTNTDDTNVARWRFEVRDSPVGSTVAVGAVLSDGAVPTAPFTPDLTGSYLIRLTVWDVTGNSSSFQDLTFGVYEAASGRLIVPFSAKAASLNLAGQLRGWAVFMKDYLKAIDNKGRAVIAAVNANTTLNVGQWSKGIIDVDSSIFSADRQLITPTGSAYAGMQWIVFNRAGASVDNVIVKTAAGASVTVAANTSKLIWTDGVDDFGV